MSLSQSKILPGPGMPAEESDMSKSASFNVEQAEKQKNLENTAVYGSSYRKSADMTMVGGNGVQTKDPSGGSGQGSSNNSENGDTKKDEPKQMVGATEIFRFASSRDRYLMFFGTLCSIFNGVALPCMIIVFGTMSNVFINDALLQNYLDYYWSNITYFWPNVTQEYLMNNPQVIVQALLDANMTEQADTLSEAITGNLLDSMRVYAYYYAGLGGIVMITSYIQVACWQTTSYNQSQRIREKLFRAILRQEISWFDTHEVGELNTRLTDDINNLETGIGEKLSMFFQFFSAFIAGFVIGFVYGWQLTLIILAVTPLLAISAGVMSRIGAKLTAQELKFYARAGAVAEEVLGAIRTVTAFSGQKKEAARYERNLVDARDFGIKKGFINGGSMGIIFLIIFGTYGLAFWSGTQMVVNHGYTPGDIIVVFFCILIGAFSLGNAAPNIQDFATARGAAFTIFSIIDQEPAIDSYAVGGKKLNKVVGNITFKGVRFNYPSRPDVTVLNGVDLQVNVGQTVALVGSSGCGKSTTVQLIQRFYDPQEGEVLLDGINVREFNLKWLRQQIGVVSQEPVLFATTIAENITYGREGVTEQEIQKAAQEANAHNFIMKLPKKYETLVGERGAQLSGGQKQRIAIARALVRDPKVLLLDEATSALDTESESTVQAALDKARQGRTTIVIAHRLSTIRTADLIAGFTDGRVAESGSHEQLMKVGGVYQTLVTNQTKGLEEDDESVLKERTLSTGSYKDVQNKRVRLTSMSSNAETANYETQKSMPGEEEEEDIPAPDLKRILRLNSSEAGFIVLGCVGATISGIIQPAFAVAFTQILTAFTNIDQSEILSRVDFISGMFAVLGVVAGCAMFLQSYCFARSGEYLTMRMRNMTFHALLRQDIGYYDDHTNSTGALCARLATDASLVKGATGSRFGTIFQALTSIIAALAIGFVFSWQLTLLILCFVPFIMLAGFIRMRRFTGNTNRKSTEAATKIAIEAIENMRTVAALTKEDKFHSDFSQSVALPYNKNRKSAHVEGAAYGLSQSCMFFAYAASFTFGAWLIQNQKLTFEHMFLVFSAIVFSAMAVGQASSFAPDYGKAKLSAAKIFQLLDRVPAIDNASTEGKQLENVEGNASGKEVHFKYPTRPNTIVLNGINFEAKSSQMVALVGSSGCGKSTVVQLLERFYDPESGSMMLEDNDLKSLKISWGRSQMGIVSQEPILFDRSIKDNIAYGDNSRDNIPMHEIIEAAKQANIHNFIEALPLGYDTNVGDKGAQLSGGQKQRVAIARALIRNPKLLLLDEATSALDTESEKIVQEALDKAQVGRTSIVIAHRLSTIQNADCIIVIKNGQIVEKGKHNELMALKGQYYKLNKTQVRPS